jgi:hypothetical protein
LEEEVEETMRLWIRKRDIISIWNRGEPVLPGVLTYGGTGVRFEM